MPSRPGKRSPQVIPGRIWGLGEGIYCRQGIPPSVDHGSSEFTAGALAGTFPCGRLLGSDCIFPDRFDPGVETGKATTMHPDSRPPHILCINHAPEILSLLRDLLEQEGYRASILTVAERDLEAIVDLRPDLITLDYMWTSSDDEWTFLTMLRMDRRTQHIPVILCTGAIREVTSMQHHLSSLGVRVVFKPFDIDTLLEAVEDALGRDPVTGQTARRDG